MKAQEIDTTGFSLGLFWNILKGKLPITLSEVAREKIKTNHHYLQERMMRGDEAIYGVNTGFGSLYNKRIGKEDLAQLQTNLVISHACGAGREIDSSIVKAMMLLKVQNIAIGHSAVHPATCELLISLYNRDIIPVVYERGSLGASGDLAPLAHMSLPLLGLGEVYLDGVRMPAIDALNKVGLAPVELGAKEGLALLNGTQFMAAHAAIALKRSIQLCNAIDQIAAISADAFNCSNAAYNHLLHQVRPHPGQLTVAERMLALRTGSAIMEQEKEHVQDPYSFRCIPQVHGASRDVIEFFRATVEREIGAVTDNPTVFHEEDEILSGGNFHGQPLALGLDMLAIAVAELGSISERRVYKLISGQRGLPAFLVAEPGLNSGFMIPQYAAASMVSANKQLCTPASVDTIDSSNGQEDHVSMGANAAVKCLEIVSNVERIIAIELMNAAQAIEFWRPMRSSAQLEDLIADFRKEVPFVERDVIMHDLMERALKFVRSM